MVHEISEVNDLTSSLSPADYVVGETSLVGTDIVSDPLVMDAVPIQIVAQTEHKVEIMNEEGESLKIGISDDYGDVNDEIGAAEEEGEDVEVAVEEDKYNFNDVDREDEEVAAEEDEYNFNDLDEEDEEVVAEEDAYNFDDVDEYEEEQEDEDDADDGDGDDGDDDDDEEEEEEEEDLMEEDGGQENKEDDVDGDKQGRTTERESKKEESLEPKVEKLRKSKVFKKVIVKTVNKSKRDDKDAPMDKVSEGNAKEEIEEKGEGSSKNKVQSLRKMDRKKVVRGSSEKVASKLEDKRNSTRRKMHGSKRAESMGMIFMCSSKTKKDCYRYQVLGLPAGKRDLVGKIYKGMRLFLYDVDLKLMYGIYKASGRGGYNIEPKAFKSQFPSQVRFTVLEDCIPLAEENFRKVIKENYFTKTKFDCQLKPEQVKKLCKLFIAASKGPKGKRLDRSLKAKPQASVHRDRSRAQGVGRSRALDEGRRFALDEKRRFRDYPHIHHRKEVVASPAAGVSQVPSLPPPVAAPLYAYDRTLEMDAYRRNMLVEHRDPYRQPFLERSDPYRLQPVSEHRDVYRQEPLLVHYDSYRRDGVREQRDLRPINMEVRHRDEIARHDPYISYREGKSYRDEIARDDPYISYREGKSYRDPVYIEHLSPEHDRYRPIATEYRSREAPISDYYSTRPLYRY